MKVSIKDIENGWLVHYEVYKGKLNEYLNINYVKEYEKEKAFTYDVDDELEDTWKKVIDFVEECFSIKAQVAHIEYKKEK